MEFRPEPVDLSRLVGEVRDILRDPRRRRSTSASRSRSSPGVGAVVADSGAS